MQYDMVFEGGGAKGMVFVGAMQELQARSHTPARLLGTSAGSIMATFLAAGYDSEEMDAALSEELDGKPVFMGFLETPPAMSEVEIQKSAVRKILRDINAKIVPDKIEESLDDAIASALANSATTSRIFSFIERGGFFAADFFIRWLRAKLNMGIYPLARGAHPQGEPRNFGDMTMTEFYQAVGIDLSLVASDTTAQQLIILNHRTAPDLPVVYGVRMSMSVPLLWHEVVWQSEWGTYRGKNIDGHTIVDGGLLSNFPIELFLSDQPPVTAVMGEKTTSSEEVLGFLIDESAPVPGAPPPEDTRLDFDISQLRTVGRIKDLMNTMMQAHDKTIMETYQHLVVRLPAKGYGTIEFGMSPKRRQALVDAGRQSTKDYFDRVAAAPEGAMADAFALEGVESTSATDRIALKILAE